MYFCDANNWTLVVYLLVYANVFVDDDDDDDIKLSFESIICFC